MELTPYQQELLERLVASLEEIAFQLRLAREERV